MFCLEFGCFGPLFQAESQAAPDVLPGVLPDIYLNGGMNGVAARFAVRLTKN